VSIAEKAIVVIAAPISVEVAPVGYVFSAAIDVIESEVAPK
jgi:hypothetical protein